MVGMCVRHCVQHCLLTDHEIGGKIVEILCTNPSIESPPFTEEAPARARVRACGKGCPSSRAWSRPRPPWHLQAPPCHCKFECSCAVSWKCGLISCSVAETAVTCRTFWTPLLSFPGPSRFKLLRLTRAGNRCSRGLAVQVHFCRDCQDRQGKVQRVPGNERGGQVSGGRRRDGARNLRPALPARQVLAHFMH